MKITKAVIKNFRGIKEYSLDFSSDFVNVINGPNESGKSSIVQALNALFTYYDDSKHLTVKDFMPKGQDVGSEIEAHIELGEYSFKYYKCFNKHNKCLLEIFKPTKEQKSGRDAHNYVEEILAKNLDANLWKALMVMQTKEIEEVALRDCISLEQALEQAAGGSIELNGNGQLILTRIRDEYNQYWWKDGSKLLKPVTDKYAELEALKERLAQLGLKRDKIALYITDVASLEEELLELGQNQNENQEKLDALQGKLALISRLERENEQLLSNLDNYQDRKKARQDKLEDFNNTKCKIDEIENKILHLEKDEKVTAISLKEGEQEQKTIFEIYGRVNDEIGSLERQKESWLRAGALAQEQHQLAEIEDLKNRQMELDDQVLAVSFTSDDLIRLKASYKALQTAEVKLAQDRVVIKFAALRKTKIIDGNEITKLDLDAVKEYQIDEYKKVFEIPNSILITVQTGQGLEQLKTERNNLFGNYELDLEKFGITSVEEGEMRLLVKDSLQKELEKVNSQMEVIVHDKSEFTIRKKIAKLEDALLEDASDSENFINTEQDLEVVEDKLASLYLEGEQVAAKIAIVEQTRQEQMARHFDIQGQLNVQKALLKEASERQSIWQVHNDYELLSQGVNKIDVDVSKAQEELESNWRLLAEAGADKVKQELGNYENSLVNTRSLLHDRREQKTKKEALINDYNQSGEENMYLQLESELDFLKNECLQLDLQSQSIKLLYETVEKARQAMQLNYIQPLRNEINNLGKVVFGADFSVDINSDTLTVNRRHLHGKTIDWAQLSVGAREQLGIIIRLAIARLVNSQDCPPIIIDDALGYSDSTRTNAVSAMFSQFTDKAQIIILTCNPARYQNIANAHYINLVNLQN